MTDADRIAELEKQVEGWRWAYEEARHGAEVAVVEAERLRLELEEAQSGYSRVVEKLRLAHVDLLSRDATIARLSLQLSQTRHALSAAQKRQI